MKEKTEETKNVNSEVTVDVEESDMLVALRVERDEEVATKMDELESVLTNETSTTDEKNNAFEELKLLNLNIGKEEELETLILDTYKIKSYVEINNDQIKVVVNSSEHDSKLANDIMRTIQGKFDEKMYITIKFETN